MKLNQLVYNYYNKYKYFECTNGVRILRVATVITTKLTK